HSACLVLALDIFNTHRPFLSQSLSDPVSVAIMLQREGVITGQVLASVESASPSVPNQREVLLAAIIVAIESKYSLLQTFASVLCKFTGNVKVGTVIQRDYDTQFSKNEFVTIEINEDSSTRTITPSSPHTPTAPTVEIPVRKSKSREFSSMRASLGRMLYKVHKAILKKSPSIDDIKILIILCNSDLKGKLAECNDISSVVYVIEGECSLTDIELLETVVEEFEVTEAKEVMQQYKATLEEFCHSISLDLCLKEKFDAVNTSPSLKCESATYVFDWRPDEKKLKDITDILSKTSGKFVTIKYIDTGYSIVVTCSFPHSLTGALIIKLSENLELLINNGLMKLTVGYCTIWKKQKIQEIQEPLEEEVQEIKEQPHDTKRQKELKETAQQLTHILSEKEKELNKMKEEIQELSLIKKTKEDQNEEECTLVELKEIKEATKLTNDLEEKLQMSLIDYKRDTLKLDQEICSEQTLDKRGEDQQVIHQEIKEQLDRLKIKVESQQTHTQEVLATSVNHTNQLQIIDLAEVLQLLRRHGYLGDSYYDLGLFLGLSFTTLDVITRNNKGDVESCLRECLTKWLQKADKVQETKGGPSIYSLVSALRGLGENGVADGIDMEKHPACRILARYTSNQSLLSTLPQLVIVLYQASLIKEMTIPVTRQGKYLLIQIKEAVCKEYFKLAPFAEILCKVKVTAKIGNTIMKEYKAYCSGDFIQANYTKGLKIYLPMNVTSEFKTMRLKFGQTFFKVGSIMMSDPQSPFIDNIKSVLRTYDKTLRPQVAQCQDIRDILALVGHNSPLDDISVLEYFVDKFNIEEAKPVIKKYKEDFEEFKKTKLSYCLNEMISYASPLECERITIIVDKAAHEYTLKDVKELSSAVLENLSPQVKLAVIRDGN
uniref:Death domain-containing protein n=1 Tax=Amphimedon queenslandica TaxID=400682 RepID=A0A1X7TCQ3_AMPQE